MTLAPRHYEPTEAYLEVFKKDCVRWAISSDGVSAHNTVTNADLSFKGIERNGPVFRTGSIGVMSSYIGDDLKPLKFEYSDADISFAFSIWRQVALKPHPRGDGHDRYLFWKLDLDKVKIRASGRIRRIGCRDLEQGVFRNLRDDLVDILTIWPGEPDEIGLVPASGFYHLRGLPHHGLIVTGDWLDDEWRPLLFRSFSSMSGVFRRRGYRTEKLIERKMRVSNWRFENSSSPQLINQKDGTILRYDGEIPYERIGVDGEELKFSYHHFTLSTATEELPLWLEFSHPPQLEPRKYRDQRWTVWLTRSASLKSGQPPAVAKSASAESFDVLREHFTKDHTALVLSVGVNAMLNWPGCEQTGKLRPVELDVPGNRPWNGCRDFMVPFSVGMDFSDYLLFEHTNKPKHRKER